MIFGKKSDVHKQISGKHSMYSHKRFVEADPSMTEEPMHGDPHSAEQNPPPTVEKQEGNRLQS
jgi:hypothetical protein